MGLVYHAYHADLVRTVAVKVLQAIQPDADTVARFRHEAQAIAKLRHQNIVDVYDFGEYQGTPYMIVEYVSGGNLADRMRKGTLDRAAVVRYLRGIATGLDYAHAHGVVHRDIKPANVLLYADDTPVLADFGLAKLIRGSSLESMKGVTTGTPAYMAPEQVAGSKVGPAADQYALATIAYEMLTGVIPFDGEALPELLYAKVQREPLAPTSRNPALSPEVDAVILRGLAKNPATRWETCRAFVEALASALGEQTAPVVASVMVTTAAVASTLPLRATPMATTAPLKATPGFGPSARLRSRKGLLALGAAAVIVILLLVGFAFVAASQPTVSLSSSTVTPGQTIKVKAAHLPANQTGDIQLHSQISYFPISSDGAGNVATDITVPLETEVGDHSIRICWSGSCPASATLHVVADLALASPSGESSPSPTDWPSSTPGPPLPASPNPTSSPVPNPSSRPNPPSPSHSPSPSPLPSPTPCTPIALRVPSISKAQGFTADFHCFPAGTWTITVVQLNKQYSPPLPNTASVPAGKADYFQHFATPIFVQLKINAFVRACMGSRCYDSSAVTVGT